DNVAAFDDALASPGLVPTPSPFARPALMPVPPNPINTEVNNAVAYYLHYDVSAFFNPLSNRFWFNSPADVQFPIRRYQLRTGAGPINQGRLESLDFAGRDGADLLLQNVISFDIKVWDPMALVATPEPPAPPVSFYVGAFVDIGHDIFAPPYAPTPDMAGFASGVVLDGVRYRWNPLSPFVNEATVPGYDIPVSGAPAVATPPYLPNRTYDTGTRRNNVAPAPPGADALLPYPAGIVRSQDNPVLPTTIKPAMAIPAIQIKIRVYDPNSEQTREITVVVDM
ncbi:MAG TPA: hypothetical protein PKD86_15410, partial [Gemmatales bacterium]|nr:hypothetical protein [Gemmatales bacterium]